MTILVVDDEPLVRKLLIRSIAKEFNVLEAGGSTEAVRLARSFPGSIQLAVIDQTLDGGSKRFGRARDCVYTARHQCTNDLGKHGTQGNSHLLVPGQSSVELPAETLHHGCAT
jgi:hypothetical protein